ncbi:MAG: SDR family oxidoreductase, partial [Burkholderiales bacterium]|nr:SDR family oxidoreductase [Burkholderiales bacterium]
IENAEANIRVNTLHPGIIETNIQAVAVRDNPNYYEEVSAAIPMKRFGQPEDIANAALFLASDESIYITGSELTVDGG